MNPWQNVRLLNACANAMLALVAAAVVVSAAWWLIHRPMFTLRQITVSAAPGQALRHVSAPVLRTAGLRDLRGNFFTVDLDAVRASFERAPWVRRASVRRVWPNRLHVAVEEHRAAAAWGDGRYLNPQGELFAVNADEAEEDGPLPELDGPEGSEREVLRKFGELAEQLRPLAAAPVALTLSDRYAWNALLDNGTSLVLGRDQGLPTDERVERFVRAWPELAARLTERPSTVDLRYPNGFAIRVAEARPAANTPSGRGPAPANSPARKQQ